ncbi:MAG: hypothetical protein ACREX5_04070, partial [Achromobacter pestifer]
GVARGCIAKNKTFSARNPSDGAGFFSIPATAQSAIDGLRALDAGVLFSGLSRYTHPTCSGGR